MKPPHVFLACCLIASFAFPEKARAQTRYLTQGELNKIINRSFGNLVTGNVNTGEISNYASLDPVDGSFTLKGSIPIGSDDVDSLGKLSYLGITLSGDLVNESYASLFSNSSLNTNVSIQLQYQFRIGKAGVSYSLSDMGNLALQRQLLTSERENTDHAIDQSIAMVQTKMDLLRYVRTGIAIEKAQKAAEFTDVRKYVDSINSIPKKSGKDSSALTGGIDSLSGIDKKIDDLQEALFANRKQQDSLGMIMLNSNAIRSHLHIDAYNGYKKNKDSLILKAPLKGWSTNWFSIAAGVGRQKYYTFDQTQVFGLQVTKNNLTTGNVSLAWNYYSANALNNQMVYLNAGFGWSRSNNTDLFSTMAVTDRKTIVNGGGDSTRTIEKKYNAYTDTIRNFNNWDAFFNFYFLYGKRPGGFHLFPDVNFRSDKLVIANLGIGYIVSFQNAKKDEPVLNVEAYVKFQDLANQQKAKSGFFNRNEIGLSFTLPVSLFSN